MKSARIPAAIVAATGLASMAMAQSGTLSTGAPNNGSGGVYMDLTNVGAPVSITSFDVAYTGTVGDPVDVEVWTRPGSYVGFDASPTGWTLTQTVQGVKMGATVLSPLELTDPILIDGQTAVYIHAVLSPSTGGIRYNGTAAAPPQTTWANDDLELFSDIARTGAIPFGGTPFTPRTFAGNINYVIDGAVPCYADCDESGELDFFDFLCFQNAFAAGDPYADCDESGELDFFDFLCFQNEFAAGCP